MKKLWNKWTDIALVKRILVGLILGAILGIAVPGATGIAILGDVFVSALKAIAPLLVFFLVISSLCNAGKSHGGVIKTVIILYMFSTVLAAVIAVFASMAFPVKLTLATAATTGRVDDGIRLERIKTEFLRNRADYIIDTTHLLTRELKKELNNIFVDNGKFSNMMISVLSFGFKYGIPEDADLVFDVRFLPNPYYVDELRPQTGMDEGVYNYVMDNETARQFAQKLEDMVEFLIPNYAKEGKTSLVIAIGCTGGKHRSVTLARVLYNRLVEKREYGIRLEHRDIGKDALLKK